MLLPKGRRAPRRAVKTAGSAAPQPTCSCIPEATVIHITLGAAPSFELRRAHESDYAFVERLYVGTMQPLLTELGSWDERLVLAKFRRSFNAAEASIISVDGEDVGWLQTSESQRNINLHQIHIAENFRSRGIGGSLIKGMLKEALAKKKSVCLNVVKNNPAIRLYLRLGFRVIREDGDRFRMEWRYPARRAGFEAKPRRPKSAARKRSA
jgi:ribosomal protein S18 acetylase RimI-like enzyme